MKNTTNSDFTPFVEEVYVPCGLKISNLVLDKESKEYEASSFQLNALKIIARRSKITPKKIGQFVTLWKRNVNGETMPLEETDEIDFIIINSREGSHLGQFVFPKSILMEKGIVSHGKKSGKRGFRVYPPWSRPTNKTAQKTQKWQLEYFLTIEQGNTTDLHKARSLYLQS
ncbi:MepB family protein [Arenibacter sp. F26102]|uniref:MepB family protein n=1 Tax=Arenibacter sp. F26102 TaxID=2926416 RepID=UPI001FF337FE|nr:MepB family protein [Arenibacter sp. F26102]MCK0145430.1 MepB family protein [Arenibacter sp. F26102]